MKIEEILHKMRSSPGDVRFTDVCKVCDHYFGTARQNGTSHRIYKTPWIGDPRVNIQKGKNGRAKEYQVNQVLKAITKLEAEREKESR